MEIEMVKDADRNDRISVRPESDSCEKNPKPVSSDPSTVVVSERRDDFEGDLLPAPPLLCREGTEEISIPPGLTEEERSLYLTTFLPPDSQLPRKGKQMIIRVR